MRRTGAKSSQMAPEMSAIFWNSPNKMSGRPRRRKGGRSFPLYHLLAVGCPLLPGVFLLDKSLLGMVFSLFRIQSQQWMLGIDSPGQWLSFAPLGRPCLAV